jgi:hypothetical protein
MTLPTNGYKASPSYQINGSPSKVLSNEKDTSITMSTAPFSGQPQQQPNQSGGAYIHSSFPSLPPPPSPYFHVYGHPCMDYSTGDSGRAAGSPYESPGTTSRAHLRHPSGSPTSFCPQEGSATAAALIDTTELIATPGCTCKKSR